MLKCIPPNNGGIQHDGTAPVLWMLVEPLLYSIENMFVLPASHPALLARGAAILDGACLAGTADPPPKWIEYLLSNPQGRCSSGPTIPEVNEPYGWRAAGFIRLATPSRLVGADLD